MRYRLKNFIIYFVSCVLFFFIVRHSLNSSASILHSLTSYLAYPIIVLQNKLITSIKFLAWNKKTIKQLQQELSLLRTERDDLLREKIALQSSSTYTQQIKELVDFKKRYNTDHALLAQIIMKHFSQQSHYIYVDIGSNKGAATDMVAVYKNCLIGKVIQAYPFYSKVLLITDKACNVAAYCSKTNIHGIHTGLNRLDSTYLDHVSHLARIAKGDVIISSGQGLVFPQGFALGKIHSFRQEGLQWKITVQPLFDLDALEYCYLIQKGGE